MTPSLRSRPGARCAALALDGCVVVSPHLDDAVLSLGGTINAATRRGARVDVLTVHAGDPLSEATSDASNRLAGFRTAGEAARRRREEDAEACALIGARPRWLDLSDDDRDPTPTPVVAQALAEAVTGYDGVLVPGHPLTHPDHLRVSRLALEARPPGSRTGLYREQPYASWALLSRRRDARASPSLAASLGRLGLDGASRKRWTRLHNGPADWWAKNRAMGAYGSQLAVLRRAPRTRVLGYEALTGGEAILWLEPA